MIRNSKDDTGTFSGLRSQRGCAFVKTGLMILIITRIFTATGFAAADFTSLTEKMGALNLLGIQGMQLMQQNRLQEAEPVLIQFENDSRVALQQFQELPAAQKKGLEIMANTFADTHLSSLQVLGDCRQRLGRFIEAEKLYQEGLELVEMRIRSSTADDSVKQQNENHRLKLLRGLAELKVSQRKFLAASIYYERLLVEEEKRLLTWLPASNSILLADTEKIDLSPGAKNTDIIAHLFDLMEDANKALLNPSSGSLETSAQSAKQISLIFTYMKTFTDLQGEMIAYTNAAGLHSQLNNFDKAWEILQKPGYKRAVNLLEQFAGEEPSSGDLQKNLASFRSEQAQIGILNFFTDSSSMLRRMKKYEDALAALLKAKPLAKKITNPLYKVIYTSHVALTFLELKKWDLAEKALKEAFAQVESVSAPYQDMLKMRLHLQRGKLKSAQEKVAEALQDIKAGEILARNLRDDQTLWDLLLEKGDLLFQNKCDEDAFLAMKEAIDQIETFRSFLGTEEFRRGFMTDKSRAYETMIKICLRANKQREAFHYAERAKARAFLDLIGEEDKKLLLYNKAAPENLQKIMENEKKIQEYRIKGEPDTRGGGLFGLFSSNPAPQTDSKELFPKGSQLLKEQNKILAESSVELADLYDVDPISTASMAALLSADTALLQYFQGDPRHPVNLFVLKGGESTPEHFLLPITGSELATEINKLLALIQSSDKSNSEELEEVSRKLYSTLIAPAAGLFAETKRLVIVPHGNMHFLPFGIMQTPSSKALLEEKEIAYLPSGSSLYFCRNKKPNGEKNWLGYALGALKTGEFSSLPGTEKEVREIAGMFTSKKPVTYFEDQLSARKLSKEAENKNIIHLATHGFLNPFSPLESSLLIGRGTITVAEVMNWNLSADLTILSACQSALGSLDSGDEIVGLTRAFLFAGSRSIISGLWSVPDRPTAFLMTSFYRHLLDGKTKSESLRQAQLETRQQYPDPKSWAAFVLTGDWL